MNVIKKPYVVNNNDKTFIFVSAMSCSLANEKIWLEKPMYDEAEREYYKRLAKVDY